MQFADDQLLGVTDCALKLGISELRVRMDADRGALRCLRDSVGRRLFRWEDVRAYRRELRRRRRRGEARMGRPRRRAAQRGDTSESAA